MLKKFLFITTLVFFCSSAWAQLMDSPWPKKHYNLKNTGYTPDNTGTTTGMLKWELQTEGLIKSTPVLDNNNKLYFGATDGTFFAVYRDSGYVAWKYKTSGAIEFASAAIDVNGIVYIGNFRGDIYAFDTLSIDPATPSTWVPLWTFRTDGEGAIQSSITIDTDGTVIVPSNDGHIYALNPNGTLKWKSAENYGSIFTTPAIDTAKNRILFGSQSPQDRFYYDFVEAPEDFNCAYIPVLSYNGPTFFTLNRSTGIEETNFPRFCPPGGMFASPVVNTNGSYLLPFLDMNYGSYCADADLEVKNANIWSIQDRSFLYEAPVNYPTDNSCIIVSRNAISGSGTKFSGEIWSTPSVINDNSYFIAYGTRIGRYLPSGNPYNQNIVDVGSRIESSPAVDRNENVYFGSDGGVFYCFCSACSESENLIIWRYPADGKPLKDQNGKPVKIKSSPAIDNDAKHSVYIGAGDGKMYAFYDGPSIKGKVTKKDETTPLNGVKITITNTETLKVSTIYTDGSGNYVSPGLEAGQYIVSAQLNNYVFSPVDPLVDLLSNDNDQNLNFTASLSYTITGRIVSSVDGSGVSNVSIALVTKNSQGVVVYSADTQTDFDGYYSFSGVGFGTTTLTPSRPGWGFDPAFMTQVIDSSIIEGSVIPIGNNEGTLGFQISGRVLDATIDTETGLAGVLISLSSSGLTVDQKTTDAQGMFSFTGLENGSYTVTPTLAPNYKFEPSSSSATIADASVLDLQFQGAQGIKISGRVTLTDPDTTYDGIVVSLYKNDETLCSKIFKRNDRTLVKSKSVTSTGTFAFMGIEPGTYIIVPTAEDLGFNPESEKRSAYKDVPGLTFTASGGFSISGRLTNMIGIPQSGMSVYLIGNSFDIATTGIDGSYMFSGLEPGDYSITPEPSGFYITAPVTKNVSITSESLRRQNFMVFSYCTSTYLTFPFWGANGTSVNIIGSNFGPTPATGDAVDIVINDAAGTTASAAAGVYFGTNDPSTWVPATVTSWTPFLITAEVPLMDLRLVRVWVVRPGLTSCINVPASNFFFNTRP